MTDASPGAGGAFVQVSGLKKYFYSGRTALRAVDGVGFDIKRGETLGLVGESGCGKTTVERTLVKLYEPTGGEIIIDGADITKITSGGERRAFARKAQMIFQDPYASLDPRMTVGDIIGEGLDIHGLCGSRAERQELIYAKLESVGLQREHADRFPHEFSGGQRQRIGIARSLAVDPRFIVCDEPISALDVSVQAQIVNLLIKLQRDLGLTYLFIAHDLSMVKHISDRVGVMYLGKLVEVAASAELYKNPAHPYTKALFSAIPAADPDYEKRRRRVLLQGEVPSPIDPPPGCRFSGRCQYAAEQCRESEPELREISRRGTSAPVIWTRIRDGGQIESDNAGRRQ